MGVANHLKTRAFLKLYKRRRAAEMPGKWGEKNKDLGRGKILGQKKGSQRTRYTSFSI